LPYPAQLIEQNLHRWNIAMPVHPESCPKCGVLFKSYRALMSHMNKKHVDEYTANAMAVLAHARLGELDNAQQQPALVEAARERTLAPGEPALPPPLEAPSPYVADLGDVISQFGNQRTLNFFLRHERMGTSLKDAPEVIAEEQADTIGARMPLIINASKGFSEQHTALRGLADKLGLRFNARSLRMQLDGDVIECTFFMREPLALAKYLYRFVTRAHCEVRELRDPAGGGRVYADPYSGTYAEQQQRRMQAIDPNGVLLLLKLYADETPITKAMERCVYPMNVYNLALPLEELRSHAQAVLLCYFSHFKPGLLASLSAERARKLRKSLHRAAKRMLFAGYRQDATEALIGESMTGADGRIDNVFVRFAGLSMDCVEIWKWTQTLANRTCWCCYAPTGEFHWPFLQYDARTRSSQLRLLDRAWERFPQSDAQRRTWLRPKGLHPEPNEMLHVPGLDVFLGTPAPPLHIFYQGLLKKLMECVFRSIQRQVTKVQFTGLGKRIDAWLMRFSTNCPWLRTTFPKGLSHFLYGAYLDPNDPWACTVQFGKIASKHVYANCL
jgi:hypothetical protein